MFFFVFFFSKNVFFYIIFQFFKLGEEGWRLAKPKLVSSSHLPLPP